MRPSQNPRVIFRTSAGFRSGVESTSDVDRLADIAVHAGARNVEGPGYDEGPGYYAVFIEDQSGNRLEICHREDEAA